MKVGRSVGKYMGGMEVRVRKRREQNGGTVNMFFLMVEKMNKERYKKPEVKVR